MPKKRIQNENVIRGSCPDFVCSCCRTKYGWEHQIWCDFPDLLEPVCKDCAYYNVKHERCGHPAKKWKWRNAG